MYQAALKATVPVHDYLKIRGITGDSAQSFNLGYVAAPYQGHDDYMGRLSIPYVTPTGICGMKFRTIEGLTPNSNPKYTGLAGVAPRIYNAGVLRGDRGDTVIICEGELDAVVAQQVTGIPAVGIPGVEAWKPYFRRCFAGMKVFMVPDADPENERTKERPGEKLLAKVRESVPLIVVRLPEPHDVSSYVSEFGAAAFKERFGD